MVVFETDFDWGRLAWIGFAALLALTLLWVVQSFVGTFVFGVFIYYATRRLHRRVSRRVWPRSLAAGVSLGLLALPALVILYYTIAVALQELDRFLSQLDVSQDQLGPYYDVISPYLELSSIVEDPAALLTDSAGFDAITSTLVQALDYVALVGNGLLHLFVMFALAFYLLRDGPRFSRWAGHFTDAHGVFDEYVRAVDRSLDAVFYGNILNAAITGAIGAIVFSLLNVVAPAGLNVPYPALTGMVAGVASLIPIVGMKLVYVPVGLYLVATAAFNGEGWWFVVLFGVVSFLIVDVLPDLIIRPYVSGGTLHVGALMFAYVLGPLLWGWYGIFLGPILLVLVVHLVRIVLPELLTGRRIRPYSVDPAAVVPGGPTGSVSSPVGPGVDDGSSGDSGSGGTRAGADEDTSADRPADEN